MAFFNKKKVDEHKKEENTFFVRVIGDDWIQVVRVLRDRYHKRDIRIMDDTVVVDEGGEAGETKVTKVFFDGNMNEYVDCLVELSTKHNINRVEEETEEEEAAK